MTNNTALAIPLKPGDENQADDVVHGRYEAVRRLRPEDVVLDIGAHVGYFATHAAAIVGPEGRVYAFEPHPENFFHLEKNCRDFPNIRPSDCAVWDTNSQQPLYPMNGNSGGHSMFPFDGHLPPIAVKTVNLSWWLVINQVKPTFIKIDAESSELKILTSLLRTECRPSIALEIHTEMLYQDCRALLMAHGYAVLPDTPVCRRTLMFANLPDDIGVL